MRPYTYAHMDVFIVPLCCHICHEICKYMPTLEAPIHPVTSTPVCSREELSDRFASCMVTMRELDLFWRRSSCDTAIKVYTPEAVLRSKLLYGFEPARLVPSIS